MIDEETRTLILRIAKDDPEFARDMVRAELYWSQPTALRVLNRIKWPLRIWLALIVLAAVARLVAVVLS